MWEATWLQAYVPVACCPGKPDWQCFQSIGRQALTWVGTGPRDGASGDSLPTPSPDTAVGAEAWQPCGPECRISGEAHWKIWSDLTLISALSSSRDPEEHLGWWGGKWGGHTPLKGSVLLLAACFCSLLKDRPLLPLLYPQHVLTYLLHHLAVTLAFLQEALLCPWSPTSEEFHLHWPSATYGSRAPPGPLLHLIPCMSALTPQQRPSPLPV